MKILMGAIHLPMLLKYLQYTEMPILPVADSSFSIRRVPTLFGVGIVGSSTDGVLLKRFFRVDPL